MSHSPVLSTLYVTGSVAATLIAVILMAPASAFAQVQPSPKNTPSHAEAAPLGMPGIHVTPYRRRDPRDQLNARHEIATMDAIQTALNHAADGSTFVWHHRSGRLSAIIRPTTSFRNTTGQVCRHIHLLLNTGGYSRKSEGIACRLPNRIWSLDG